MIPATAARHCPSQSVCASLPAQRGSGGQVVAAAVGWQRAAAAGLQKAGDCGWLLSEEYSSSWRKQKEEEEGG
jgi:hypothetical protein